MRSSVLDLRAVVKTSSAEGMHLAVPLRPGHTYPQARALVQLVAQALERATPTSSRPSGTRAAATAS